jgi:hypothetical protein
MIHHRLSRRHDELSYVPITTIPHIYRQGRWWKVATPRGSVLIFPFFDALIDQWNTVVMQRRPAHLASDLSDTIHPDLPEFPEHRHQ